MPAVLAAVFVSSIPATIVLPMLPSIGSSFGVAPTQLGLLVGIYPLMSMIASPLWGRLSDRFGRRPILLTSLAGGSIAFVVFGLSDSFAGLLVARAMQGLAGTPRGLAFAIASDLTDARNRARGMGAVTAAMAIGFTVGPLIGGLFMSETPGSLLASLRVLLGASPAGFSHLVPALLGTLLNASGFLIVLIGFRETWTPADRSVGDGDGRIATEHRLLSVMASTAVLIAVGMFLLSGFIQGSQQFAFTLWADMDMRWTAQQIAWATALLGLGFALASGVVLRPMVKRIGSAHTVLSGAIVDLTGLVIFLSLSGNWPMALTGLFISALGGGLWSTTILSLLSREIPEQHQGAALGIANGAGLVGRVTGPVVAGSLASAISPRSPFLLLLICITAVILRGLHYVRAERKTQPA